MKKPEVTVQYFIDRGRRRTLTFSIQRLNTLLIGAAVFFAWSLIATGYVFFHIFTGVAPFQSKTASTRSAAVVPVGPDQPARKNTTSQLPVSNIGTTSLAAKPIESVGSKTTGLIHPEIPQQPVYTLASLMNFESTLRKNDTPEPLRFRNVRIHLEGDHLKVSADIEKVHGDFIEGHSFIVAEYLDQDGQSSLLTSHGRKDWDSAIAPTSIESATSFRARIMSKKRFDIVNQANLRRKLVAVKLVARDKRSGMTIIEAVSLPE